MANEAKNNNVKSVYVYDIPFLERKQLCRILDLDDKWKELAGLHMGFCVFDILEIENEVNRSRGSPSDILLERWGVQNHTILELFVLLDRSKNRTALDCLRGLVDPKFHRLIDGNGNSTTSNLSQSCKVSSDSNSNVSNVVPIHIKYIEQGVKIESSNNKILNGPPYEGTKSSNEPRSSSATSDGRVAESAGALMMIPYAELAIATQDWNASNILGKGGFGVVYKGDWKHTAVAIKRLKSPTSTGGVPQESLTELKYLNACRHDNVLPLYGYSVGGEEPCLVYQLMSGGSLEDRLKCRNLQTPLPWKQRLRISQGVAKGLQYLHTVSQTPLIHGDIKSANILLDTCGEPRIGDFGLAREGPNTNEFTHMKVSRVHGTRPYLPDEFLRGHRLSPKVDVYSFGVVIFELVTGLSAYDNRRKQRFLKDHVVEYCTVNPTELGGLQDSRLLETGDNDPDLCRKLIIMGVKCVQTKARERPTMEEVWKQLIAIGIPPPDIQPM